MTDPWRKRVEIGDAVLYLGDCMSILPRLPKVDAVVTDPPYLNLQGTYKRDYQGGVGRKVSITQCVGDVWGASVDWCSAVENVAHSGVIAFSSFAGLSELGQAFSLKKIGLVTWFKRNAAPTGKGVPYYKTEFAWAFRKNPKIKWDELPSLIDVPNINAGAMATERIVEKDGKAIHPTQKPVAVIESVLLRGMDSVLDPFMGLGTTGVACANLGRKFIGIEIEERYFNIAAERITAAYAQGKLFQ